MTGHCHRWSRCASADHHPKGEMALAFAAPGDGFDGAMSVGAVIIRAVPSSGDHVAPQRLEDLPESRRIALLWSHALDLDYHGVEELVLDSASGPCRWDGNRGRDGGLVGLVAVLATDGRFHLCRRNGLLVCERSRSVRRVEPDPQRIIDHDDYVFWSTGGEKYRIHPPNGAWAGLTETRTIQWSLQLTDTTTEIASVHPRYRCPAHESSKWWPAQHNPNTRDGRMRALLAHELGADCHACGFAPGVGIDHDHFTGAVRGLLCRWCNNRIESCPHLSGCRWADYLNHPPAAEPNLTYPKRGKPWRTTSHEQRVKVLGFDPFE